MDIVFSLPQALLDASVYAQRGGNPMDPVEMMNATVYGSLSKNPAAAAMGQAGWEALSSESKAVSDSANLAMTTATTVDLAVSLPSLVKKLPAAVKAGAKILKDLVQTTAEKVAPQAADTASPVALRPGNVNFSQRSVSGNVEQYTQDMAAGNWDWDRSGPIRVMDREGTWVSFDNRRLMAAQNAGLTDVPVQVVRPEEPYSPTMSWKQAFEKRLNDVRNLKLGGPVPSSGLPEQPQIQPPKVTP